MKRLNVLLLLGVVFAPSLNSQSVAVVRGGIIVIEPATLCGRAGTGNCQSNDPQKSCVNTTKLIDATVLGGVSVSNQNNECDKITGNGSHCLNTYAMPVDDDSCDPIVEDPVPID